VLRDGEWEVLQPLWRGLFDNREDARFEAKMQRDDWHEKTRVCKVRVTVEEV
jgi:hypothetical protein